MSAAEVTTEPSRMHGVRRSAACARKPAIPAMSAPATLRSIATGSRRSLDARYMASRMAEVLRIHPSSSIPVPRPTSSTGSRPVTRQASTVAGVVLPIPRSPAMSRSAPASISSSAIRRPAATAARTSSSLSASSRSIAPEDRRILWSSSPPGTSADIARSATRTPAPACLARTDTAAPPVTMLPAICSVTACGYAETPCSAIP